MEEYVPGTDRLWKEKYKPQDQWNTSQPMQIVQAHTMCENQAYMRDYVLNDKGDVKELWFQNIAI